MLTPLKSVFKKAFTPFTIIIIPHNSGKSRQIQIPSFGIIVVIGLFLFTCSISASYMLHLSNPTVSVKPLQVKAATPPAVNKKTPNEIKEEALASIAEKKLDEIQCTIDSLKKTDEKLKKSLCYDSKEELFSNVVLTDPLSLDLEAVREEADKAAENLDNIKGFIEKERDNYFATPRGWSVQGKITEHFGRR